MPRLDKITSRGCRRLKTIACLAALWLLLPAALVLWQGALGSGGASSRISSAASTVTKRGYFLRGQWRADARTLVAAARWCFEPDLPRSGNAVYSNGVPAFASTNAAPVTRT